ncbi:hypothetical protein OKA05_00860 [Luteolibacter arcticus]|uniref:Uncharacterized protein n=1 Tax=Luteolibacter arcticus TaxID=1581411 RepID=A0ABT3GCB3_9BACT|nr:hypothetical protein [Luteolibacter arcticus]MCW1921081.1 hypothetical protein [Luteolibacter arcticus]
MEQAKETQPIRFLVTPRPLIKWKSFWLGILVLGFLGGAWVFSMHHSAGVVWNMKPTSKTDFSEWRGIYASFEVGLYTVGPAYDPFADSGFSHWSHSSRVFGEGDALLPTAVTIERGYTKIALWLLILLFLVP